MSDNRDDNNVVTLRRAFTASARDEAVAKRWEGAEGPWASAEVDYADDGSAYVSVRHRSDCYHVAQDQRGRWPLTFTPDHASADGPQPGDTLGTFGSLADALEAIFPTRGPP